MVTGLLTSGSFLVNRMLPATEKVMVVAEADWFAELIAARRDPLPPELRVDTVTLVFEAVKSPVAPGSSVVA